MLPEDGDGDVLDDPAPGLAGFVNMDFILVVINDI